MIFASSSVLVLSSMLISPPAEAPPSEAPASAEAPAPVEAPVEAPAPSEPPASSEAPAPPASSEAPAPSASSEAPASSEALEPSRVDAPVDDAAPAGFAIDAEPLPPAPARMDPSTLDRSAWRGRGFFQIHIGAMVPVGGERPGAGTVATAGGGVQLGWRAHPVFAIGVGLTTFVHDAQTTLATDSTGATVEVRDFGRLTLYDPVFLRLFIPTKRRIEPRFDVAPLLGTYRGPFGGPLQLAAGARVGAGLDVWIGPSFSLDFGVDPRLIIIDGTAGVTLQAGAGATVHW